ncbi:DUF6471 domain-containing protein [Acidithiobacillus acidisediminis]|uniref:DUF6471 domain-containing protein n=1 Tax=Acidithiobacillus acidisediminis TaxID=2937799 RepID=UPI00200FC2A9|nr:DUF6471 domain-containing protein [Acidithiobacillus sp. S30A2]
MEKKAGRKPLKQADLVAYEKARKLLKGEMLRLGFTTTDLARSLQLGGVEIDVNGLGRKIHKGGFSLAFFLQCMEAMGITQLDLYNARPPESRFSPELGIQRGEKMKLIDDEDPAYQRKGGESDPET